MYTIECVETMGLANPHCIIVKMEGAKRFQDYIYDYILYTYLTYPFISFGYEYLIIYLRHYCFYCNRQETMMIIWMALCRCSIIDKCSETCIHAIAPPQGPGNWPNLADGSIIQVQLQAMCRQCRQDKSYKWQNYQVWLHISFGGQMSNPHNIMASLQMS